MYSTCHGGADWETEKAAWKHFVEIKGCAAGSPPPSPTAQECASGVNVQGAANEERCCSGMTEVIEELALTVATSCPAGMQADIVSSLPLLLLKHWLS